MIKMVCTITCSIAVAFIFAAIYMFFTSKSTAETLESTFTSKSQKFIYKEIVEDRLKIYYIASIVGFIVALFYVLFFTKNRQQTTLSKICIFVVLFFVIQILFYLIYPKKAYMLDYINTNDQAKAWMKVYNEMMRNYLIGFVLGLVGFGLLCLAFFR